MTLHTLKAKLKLVCNHMLYVYDDPAKGVFDEPLMHAATDILAISRSSTLPTARETRVLPFAPFSLPFLLSSAPIVARFVCRVAVPGT